MKVPARLALDNSLVKFLFVGGLAFCVEYGSFYALYSKAGLGLIYANSLSFGLGLLTSFIANRLWTFSHHEYQKKTSHQFTYYFLLALMNLLLTNLLVVGLTHVSVNAQASKFIAMIVTSSWNYFLYKKVIFKHKEEDRAA